VRRSRSTRWSEPPVRGLAPEGARAASKGAGVTLEEVEEVWTYCTAADFRKHKPDLVRLAEWIATEGDQEAIALLIDSGMELIARKETS
jgi:hypothetical protein